MKINVRTKSDNSRLRYVCDFINRHPLNQGNFELLINADNQTLPNLDYTREPAQDANYKVYPLNCFLEKKTERKLFANKYAFEYKQVYSVELEHKQEGSFITDGLFGFDIFETIFFHISRVEEVNVESDLLNDRGQIREEELFAVKHKINEQGVVDNLVVALLKLFTNQDIEKKTSIGVSHDIDFIIKFKRAFAAIPMIKAMLRFQNPLLVFGQFVRERMKIEEAPYNVFEELLIKNELASKKIYFLMGGQHKYDNSYDLDHPIFLNAVKLAKERGYKIGIHPSYESWKSGAIIRSEKERLEKAIGDNLVFSRQHYLHFDVSETPALLLAEGIEEDSSLGFTKHIGFRCGTGFPYNLYDFKNEQESKLVERPLVYMDSAALKKSNFIEASKAFFESNKMNTHITVNFHNSRFDPLTREGREVQEVYDWIRREVVR